LLAASLGLLFGCKAELYSQLDEQEGNEMLALLLDYGISSEKQPGKDNTVSLYVDGDRISDAVALLRRSGYPKNKFSTIEDVIRTDKLITTPFEEHTLYIYGLSQGIAETLSQIDGVMDTRVHIVIPQEDQSSDQTQTASASVFVKHDPNYDFRSHIPEIKAIVSSGIAGMPYDAVQVALFPAQQEDLVQLDPQDLESILSIELSAHSVLRFYLILGGCLGLLMVSMAVNVYLLQKK